MGEPLPYADSAYVNDLRAEVEALRGDIRLMTAVIEQAEEHVEDRDQRLADLAADLLETRAQLHEARAEVEKLGKANEEWAAENRRLGDKLNEYVQALKFHGHRANEAARLSAQARDDADALNKVIAGLREHIEIVESDRTDTDIWALGVIAEHNIEHETGDLLGAIARYMRDSEKARADLRFFGDKAVDAREWAMRELESVTSERDEARSDASNLGVALEAAEFDRDEARHGRDEYAAEVERLQKELGWQTGAKP